jgi:putative mRNA 3-end processing factor
MTTGDTTQHVLATGDFTRRRAGGFPGFDSAGIVDIDALFLTGATNKEFSEALTETVGAALSRAHSGSRTLVTTSGIVGPQLAYVIAATAEAHDRQIPIRIVGQAAKLYDALGYECRHVKSIPQFSHTDTCLDPGVITIAGPEVPSERSSGRLFGVLKDDPNACVIQLVGSGTTPLSDGQCTIHSHSFSNHPTRDTLVDIHDDLDPTTTVITHVSRGAAGSFNDLDSVVWGAGDTDEYVLYADSHWRLPPWANGTRITNQGNQRLQQFASNDLVFSLSVPSLEQHDTPDLAAEGIHTDSVAATLRPGKQSSKASPATTSINHSSTADSASTSTSSMTNDNADTDDATTTTPPELTRTTGPEIDDEIDPQIQMALDEGQITKADIAKTLAAREEALAKAQAQAASGTSTENTSNGASSDTSSAPADTGELESESTAAKDTASSPASTNQPDSADQSEDDTTDTQADTGTMNTSENGQATIASTDSEEPDSETLPARDRDSSTLTRTVQLNPVAVGLAEAHADETTPLSTVIATAVDEYAAALLSGEAAGDADERFSIDFAGSQAAARAISSTANVETDELSGLVADGLAAVIANDGAVKSDAEIVERQNSYLEAIVTNDSYVFDTDEAVIEAAIAWHVS